MIETGLGGRLDATNVLQPKLTIITDISIDHAEILGPTLELIAGEKAGIIKPGVPNVIGLLPLEAKKKINAVCRERRAPVVKLAASHFKTRNDSRSMDFACDGLSLKDVRLALPGRHQFRNGALVLRAVQRLGQDGLKLSHSSIRQGLATTCWPGRFQVLPADNGRPETILDVGHNAGGAASFADTFRRLYPGRKTALLIGFVKRKAHQEMIDKLATIASEFCLVPLATKRSVDPREMEREMNWHGVPVRRFARFDTAYKRLMKESEPGTIISIVGSHYLVGYYLERYVNR